jgi:hypothetical protein
MAFNDAAKADPSCAMAYFEGTPSTWRFSFGIAVPIENLPGN